MDGFNAGITGISVNFPETVCTSDEIRQRYPEVVASMARSAGKKENAASEDGQVGITKVWTSDDGSERTREFDEAMRPYLSDPFRGTVARRILAPGETASQLRCSQ